MALTEAQLADPRTAPFRLTTREVCQLGGFGQATLIRRIAEGRMPKAIDRGRELIFDRDAVLKALGLGAPEAVEEDDPWMKGIEAFAKAGARPLRSKLLRTSQKRGPHVPPKT